MERQGTRSAAALVGHRIGRLIACKASVPGDPAEEDGQVVGRIGVFKRKDLSDQTLEFDREGSAIEQESVINFESLRK